MTNKEKQKITRLHCPVCDSPDIYTVVGGYTGNAYKCKKCGYQGALVIEHEEDFNNNFKEALNYDEKAESTENTRSSFFTIVKTLLAILFILSLIAIIIEIRF